MPLLSGSFPVVTVLLSAWREGAQQTGMLDVFYVTYF